MGTIDLIRLAIPKGKTSVSAMFRNLGYSLPGDFDESRKYIVPVAGSNLEFILAKPVDIPTYVEYGVADLGIVGKECLVEEERDVYELVDLGIAIGHLSVLSKSTTTRATPNVATSYPKLARRYFAEKGMQAEIIKLSGGLELALLTGIADCIVDVNDKRTLGHFFELDKICSISLRLIANKVSFQIKSANIQYISDELSRHRLS
ncbi:ATP phosphoribosyltransferase [Paenibacillus harenae]|uniref:ATP phosphoribosyltransferase n=1 Tax=Paenibacillus harenae TaxID=306543 RepID=A0ABT9TV46_PAEHA|nr:ATP phosphoribosyltransferase [Paenibacillus harenae]MDQ0111240.1 ATP phosphoribosyltransferase [Paenibacillus harenae]